MSVLTFLTDANVPAIYNDASADRQYSRIGQSGKQTLLNSLSVNVNLLLLSFLFGFGVNGTVDEEDIRLLILSILHVSPTKIEGDDI